tara:strand:- start:275 stop:586 length:312 start_codon:yes stop_codon:yes gene_type:complete
MKLNQIAANQTELDLGFAQVFFSYNTPVAARLTDGSLVRTDERYSITTTKHINKWLQGCDALTVSQDRIDCLLTSASECDASYFTNYRKFQMRHGRFKTFQNM